MKKKAFTHAPICNATGQRSSEGKTSYHSIVRTNSIGKLVAGFTLVELLVVISIIAMLLAILLPSLNKARESAKSIICKGGLKTILTASFVYANEWSGNLVPVIDESMAHPEKDYAFFWNVNPSFRKSMALNSKTTSSKYVMPPEYWCPSDMKVRDEAYWSKINSWVNRISYGYNMSDRGSDSKDPFNWALNGGAIADNGRYVGYKVSGVMQASKKVMFADAGDLWTEMKGADYLRHWDRFKDDIDTIRKIAQGSGGKMTSSPIMYRHSEGTNIGYFDGHCGYSKKQNVFFYLGDAKNTPDTERNTQVWFVDPKNKRTK